MCPTSLPWGCGGPSVGRAQALRATPSTCAPLSPRTVICSEGPWWGPPRALVLLRAGRTPQEGGPQQTQVSTASGRLGGNETTAPPPSARPPGTCVPSQADLGVYGKPEDGEEGSLMHHASFFISLRSGVPASPLGVSLCRGPSQGEASRCVAPSWVRRGAALT